MTGFGAVGLGAVTVLINLVPILSLCCFITWPLASLLGIAAVIMGIIAMGKGGETKKKGLWALILGLLAIFVTPILAIIVGIIRVLILGI